MDFWRRIMLVAVFGFVLVFLTFLTTIIDSFWGGDRDMYIDKIPVIEISLNEIDLDEIINNSKEIKYEENMLSIITDNKIETFSDVQIKGRGNSTWGQPKSPFQIKFKTKVDLLGLGVRKKYILLANHVDPSNLRNELMFKLTEMIDEKYRVEGRFVELYIDDVYQGLYNLVGKVEIGKNAVDLRDDYGILMELDTLHEGDEECNYSGFGECMTVKEAVFEDDQEKLNMAVGEFMKEFNELEIVSKEGDFERIKELIDVESFAQYFLISEFGNNPDSYISSFNFYKDGHGDKIHAGPLWDFDFAFSNREWYWSLDDRFYSPDELMVQREWIEQSGSVSGMLMYYLSDIPEFQDEVRRVWQEKMSGRKGELEMFLHRQFEFIEDAALRDEEKWFDVARFLDEYVYLRDWVSRRYDFFEHLYGSDAKRFDMV